MGCVSWSVLSLMRRDRKKASLGIGIPGTAHQRRKISGLGDLKPELEIPRLAYFVPPRYVGLMMKRLLHKRRCHDCVNRASEANLRISHMGSDERSLIYPLQTRSGRRSDLLRLEGCR